VLATNDSDDAVKVATRAGPVVTCSWPRWWVLTLGRNPSLRLVGCGRTRVGNVTRAGLAVSCQRTGVEVDGSGKRTNTSSVHGFAEAWVEPEAGHASGGAHYLAGWVGWMRRGSRLGQDSPRWVGGASGEGCFASGVATLLVGGVDGVGTGKKTVAGSRWLPIR